jgi:chromate transporter
LAIIVAAFGPTPFLKLSVFFLQAALVTFGGAYAVLPFVASGAVGTFHWISAADMAHGLALAETTPGPLILVNEYVGFFAGWNACKDGTCGGLSQLAAAAVAALLTVWTTFLPCFYMVLIGAPLVERIRVGPRTQASLDSLTAAVVGVIATLGLSIARQAYQTLEGVDLVSLGVTFIALLMILSRRVPAVIVVLCGALFGMARVWHGA